ncbi:SCO3374 family protein [Streptomyces sp. NBC_01304]|uniref:SCO3374 family protein n=1 Tax=Streptomyces sp. NBC_01304 TaxID=2903818 RepID=UPI002E0F31BE|nr:SCO3374 family protein [Streptomyces sp. NBC_01304]
MALTVSGTAQVPLPRRPLTQGDPVLRWYADELGWAAVRDGAGSPVQLLTGLRFDVLQLPAQAGFAVLRRLGDALRTGPVALEGDTMRLLVAAGTADELPGLLDWLQWGPLPLDLTAVGTGGRIPAPLPPDWSGPRGAAVWVRPPEPGCEVEPTLPALTGLGSQRTVSEGGRDAAPDLVRLVDAAATQCHRLRLMRASAQPLAFS